MTSLLASTAGSGYYPVLLLYIIIWEQKPLLAPLYLKLGYI